MKNYKLLFVDDEEEVKNSMINTIDWNGLGYDLIGEASNGMDAIEKVEILDPDVIITDIRMPYMDGISLSRRVRRMNPSVEIVLLSGFNDFEYAQSAVEIGVCKYLLKPISSRQLTEFLQELKRDLDRKQQERTNLSRLQALYSANYSVLKDKFLTEWLQGLLSESAIRRGLEEFPSAIFSSDRMVVIRVHARATESVDEKLLPHLLQEYVKEALGDEFPSMGLILNHRTIFLAGLKEDDNINRLLSCLDRAGNMCRRYAGVRPSFGVSGEVTDIMKLAEASRDAKEALNYRSVLGDGLTIWYPDIEWEDAEDLILDQSIQQDFIHRLKVGNEASRTEIIERIVRTLRRARASLPEKQSYVMSLIAVILNTVSSYDIPGSVLLHPEEDYLDMVNRLTDPDHLKSWLTDIVERLGNTIEEKRARNNSGLVDDAMHYLQEHFSEPDLKLETMCRLLHVSAPYLSTLFTKLTGASFSTHLTEMRLAHAEDLLLNTNAKTFEIAEQVGYPDANYFSYVFKKKFGKSPTAYRKEKQKV